MWLAVLVSNIGLWMQTVLTFRVWPLIDTSGVDSRTVAWPDPQPAFSADPESAGGGAARLHGRR